MKNGSTASFATRWGSEEEVTSWLCLFTVFITLWL